MLEEIRVTARRTEERLQDSPIAATALDKAALRGFGATNVTAVSGLAPNVSFEQGSSFSGYSATPTLFIRGLGQSDSAIISDPAVGVYVDGFYVTRTLGSDENPNTHPLPRRSTSTPKNLLPIAPIRPPRR